MPCLKGVFCSFCHRKRLEIAVVLMPVAGAKWVCGVLLAGVGKMMTKVQFKIDFDFTAVFL